MSKKTMTDCVAALVIALAAASVSADIFEIGTRAEFNAMFPDATFEDFEEARVPDGMTRVMVSPLDSNTNNDIFQPGEIVEGLRINVPFVPNPVNLFVSSPGFANYVSHAISYDWNDTPQPQIVIDLLDGDELAFAMDVTSNPDGNLVTVSVFSGANLLGSFDVTGVGAGTFFGVFSDSDAITQITLSGDANFFGFDNNAFGVPEPGTLWLLGLAALVLRRRR